MTTTPFLSPSVLAFFEQMAFLLSAIGFFVSLKLLGSPKTARLGNFIGASSMLLAAVVTAWALPSRVLWELLAVVLLGSVVGIFFAHYVKMTAMPQMVAIFNGLGGIASVLVALAEAIHYSEIPQFNPGILFVITAWLSVLIGGVTFTGSLVAYGKLQELLPTRPILVSGQRFATILLSLVSLAWVFWMMKEPTDILLFTLLGLFSFILGVLLVIPIGGADMPVVVSLLNSYSGLAAMAAGFVVNSQLLIIAGALVGASGIILTRLMCKAMNRSLFNVVFGAFGGVDIVTHGGEEKTSREFSALDAAMLLTNANRVIVVPGYGLAVSQAQRNLREVADLLKAKGVQVTYAIHPVAGRMPGHMNVLLAEADVPYEELSDLDEVNGEFESADVALVIGANDVVNPSARTDKTSPLFGMPILDADKAKTVIILKRGKGRGFAGIENPLFTLDHSGIVYGDAKHSLVHIANEIKTLH